MESTLLCGQIKTKNNNVNTRGKKDRMRETVNGREREKTRAWQGEETVRHQTGTGT